MTKLNSEKQEILIFMKELNGVLSMISTSREKFVQRWKLFWE